MPGLHRRVYPSGSTVWVVCYSSDGKTRYKTLGNLDPETAQRRFESFCDQLARDGKIRKDWRRFVQHELRHSDGSKSLEQSYSESGKRTKTVTIPDLEREYMEYNRANKSANTCEIIQQAFWKFREFADDIPLHEVDFRMIEGFKMWRLKRVNGTTLNISLRALKAGFEYAVQLGWLEKNPFKGVKQIRIPEPDYPVYLTEDEIKKLMTVIPNEEFRRLVRFYLLTGCRRTEATSLEWKDVNFDTGTIVIRSSYTKTGRNRVLEMGRKLRELLEEQGPKETGLVFPSWTAGSVTAVFKKYVRKAGFNRKITVHSLRHTATVHFLLAGVNMFTVSKILGHTSVKVTETVYAHIPSEKKREAMDSLPY